MPLVRTLWNALVLAYTGAAFVVRGGVLLGAGLLFLVCVLGLAVMGGGVAVVGLAILSIYTPFQPFLNAHGNAITWMGIAGGTVFAIRYGYKHHRLHHPNASASRRSSTSTMSRPPPGFLRPSGPQHRPS